MNERKLLYAGSSEQPAEYLVTHSDNWCLSGEHHHDDCTACSNCDAPVCAEHGNALPDGSLECSDCAMPRIKRIASGQVERKAA